MEHGFWSLVPDVLDAFAWLLIFEEGIDWCDSAAGTGTFPGIGEGAATSSSSISSKSSSNLMVLS